MRKLVLFFGVGMFATACLGDVGDGHDAGHGVGATEESLGCDDCDVPPDGSEPLLELSAPVEIRPGSQGRRCAAPVSASQVFAVTGETQPRGPLVKDVRFQVFQVFPDDHMKAAVTVKSVTRPPGTFFVGINRSSFPANFPGSFVFCIKNPGANAVSVDARDVRILAES